MRPDIMVETKGRRRPAKVAGVLGILALAFALGPRLEMDTRLSLPGLPDTPATDSAAAESSGKGVWLGAEALETYLAAREGQFSDIVPGTEKTIVWANPHDPAPSEYVVVYFHGFSASRQDAAPLAETVAERLEANLFLTRLSGHGRSGSAMAEASVNAWVNDGVEALELARRIGRRIVLMGTSTGGTLAAWLATQGVWDPELTPWRDNLEALVLISPNFGPRNRATGILLMPWGRQITRLIQGRERCFEPRNELQGRYWTTCYPSSALLPMMGLVALVKNTDPTRLTVPTITFFSPKDEIVDTDLVEDWNDRIGSPRKPMVEVESAGDPSHHMIVGEILSSMEVTELVADQILTLVLGGS
jgi:alpha-beta hydrolase superfamily lysophospholipase